VDTHFDPEILEDGVDYKVDAFEGYRNNFAPTFLGLSVLMMAKES